MNCCNDYGKCDKNRDCPARQPAKVAVAKPLYRRCDVMGVCQSPDAECAANCLLHDPLPNQSFGLANRLTGDEHEEPIGWLETALMWAVMSLAVGLLLVLIGGAVGFLWGWLS